MVMVKVMWEKLSSDSDMARESINKPTNCAGYRCRPFPMTLHQQNPPQCI